MSSLSNYNTNNTRFVILAPFSLALFLKVQSTLKFVIRGILLSKLFWWLIFLILFIRSLVFKRRAYIVAMILLFNKIMPTCFCYMLKGLVYIIIIASLSRQPSSYIKYTKLNMRLSCNIRSVSNTECISYTRFYTF